MSILEAEERIKLNLLTSLARSQRALAQIIESMAKVTEGSEASAKHVLAHAEAIACYQRAIAARTLGLRIKRIHRGDPGKVWLCSSLRQQER